MAALVLVDHRLVRVLDGPNSGSLVHQVLSFLQLALELSVQPNAEECCLDIFLDFLKLLGLLLLAAAGRLVVDGLVKLGLIFPKMAPIELLGSVEEIGQLDSEVSHY